jgi:N-acetylmuramoyl-L-alanine amidase
MNNIINIPSPNFTTGRSGYNPEAIVIHIMEGTLSGTDSWFKSTISKVSAHYGIGKMGEIHQYVQEKDTAWHAGRVNAPSWSLIKPAGSGLYINPNFYTIGIEHEGNDDSIWTDEMYNISSSLIKEISKRWDIPLDRQHIIGHHEIYSLKTCPGSKVDINKLIALAAGNQVQPLITDPQIIRQTGKVTTITKLNIRSKPQTMLAPVTQVEPGIQLAIDGYTDQGESINGNSKWHFTTEGNWFWSGGVV